MAKEIEHLWAIFAIADGDIAEEGIMAARVSDQWFAMVTGDEKKVQKFKAMAGVVLAERTRDASGVTAQKAVLVRFDRAAVLEVYRVGKGWTK